nr:hypothetical protein [Brucella pituitosa]
MFISVPELINALRAGLYEYGHTVPQGVRQIRQFEDILNDLNTDLPDLMREECLELFKQIAATTARIGDAYSQNQGFVS